jgi:glycosyltransferase involved in cell wall biosynthesis
MRIVIATGIYPPDIGGPAYYAKGLEESLRAMGHTVETVVYGDLRNIPMGLSHLKYLFRIWPKLKNADAVIALDTASVAIPAWLAAKLHGVRFIIRTGGDFVWEHYLERTHNLVPLKYFYDEIRDFSAKEHLVFALTRFVARHSTVVFSTEMQRDVWLHPYGLKKEHTHIIGNAVDVPLQSGAPAAKNFLWCVRDIAMKNGAHVRAAFAKAKEQYLEIILEEGQVPKAELLERMKSCYAVILPSVTEISPNYILDALRFKKPFIMDKYSGFADWLSPYGIVVDPLDENDIAEAIQRLASKEGYDDAVQRVSTFSYVRSYGDIAADFVHIIKENI